MQSPEAQGKESLLGAATSPRTPLCRVLSQPLATLVWEETARLQALLETLAKQSSLGGVNCSLLRDLAARVDAVGKGRATGQWDGEVLQRSTAGGGWVAG